MSTNSVLKLDARAKTIKIIKRTKRNNILGCWPIYLTVVPVKTYIHILGLNSKKYS